MNILFVHSIGKRKFGGGEKWLITAATGLMDKGHRVFVGVRPGSRLLKAARLKGLETVAFNILSDISIWHVFRIAFFLRKHKIDVLITKGSDLSITGIAARFGGRPLVLARHGSPLRSSFKKHSFLLNKLADGIITNTKTIKELFESNGLVKKDFTRVIYNGVAVDNNSAVYDYSKKFPGKRIILSAGRLAASKGYLYLIDAISILKKEYSDIIFVVLGEGKHYRKFVAYAGKKSVSELIHFEGYIDNVVPYIKGCDFFVLPSLYEGMPNAAMEAMAYGKAVVLTRVNGAEELITDNKMGVLIPPRDPQAIADAVELLLNDKELCDKLGFEAKKHIMTNFPVYSMVYDIMSYIDEKLLEKNNALR